MTSNLILGAIALVPCRGPRETLGSKSFIHLWYRGTRVSECPSIRVPDLLRPPVSRENCVAFPCTIDECMFLRPWRCLAALDTHRTGLAMIAFLIPAAGRALQGSDPKFFYRRLPALEVGTSIERSHLRRHQHSLRSSSPQETTSSLKNMCFALIHHMGACPQVPTELAADLKTNIPCQLHVGPTMFLDVSTVSLSDVFSGVVVIRDSGFGIRAQTMPALLVAVRVRPFYWKRIS